MSEDDAYKVKVGSARFELTKIKMNPAGLNDHSMALLKSNARYPIRRSEIKTFSLLKLSEFIQCTATTSSRDRIAKFSGTHPSS